MAFLAKSKFENWPTCNPICLITKVFVRLYLTPLEIIELIARIEAVLRRYDALPQNFTFKNIEVFEEQRIVKLDGELVELTYKEFDLLMLFLQNKNIALSRDQILEKVWGFDYTGETRTVDIHVQRLRDKLNLKDDIKTVFKVGYRLGG